MLLGVEPLSRPPWLVRQAKQAGTETKRKAQSAKRNEVAMLITKQKVRIECTNSFADNEETC